jgi:hypothetical protein
MTTTEFPNFTIMNGVVIMSVFLFVLAVVYYPTTESHPDVPDVAIAGDSVAPDTFVNYCKLIQAAFFYGRKFADKKLGLTDEDVAWFNAQWVDVFDLAFYQTGITNREFILGARFGEGTHTPFPPSNNYLTKYPDTYYLFHLVKEIGMLHSQYFSRCPSCVEYSLAKINAYLKVTTLKEQIPEIWDGNRQLKSKVQADSLHAFIRCLLPAHPVNPVAGILQSFSGPQCGDTINIRSFDDITPSIPLGFQSCDTASQLLMTEPELLVGRAGKRKSVYVTTFVSQQICSRPDTCRLYFMISR